MSPSGALSYSTSSRFALTQVSPPTEGEIPAVEAVVANDARNARRNEDEKIKLHALIRKLLAVLILLKLVGYTYLIYVFICGAALSHCRVGARASCSPRSPTGQKLQAMTTTPPPDAKFSLRLLFSLGYRVLTMVLPFRRNLPLFFNACRSLRNDVAGDEHG